MKFRRIKFSSLRNEEWFNFFSEFKTFVEQTSPEVLDIEALFIVFLSFLKEADEALEKIHKSNFTALITQADELRDNAFRGLNANVRSALYHFEKEKKTAAERLITLFDHYGNIADKPYNEETASIYNFLQDIREQYQDEIGILDLTGWLNELEKTNNEFEKTIISRNQEYANRTELNMFDIRKKTGRAYLDIIERIEALMLIQGDEKFEPFFKTLNANIERYKTSINRRAGKGKVTNDDNETSE
jgi:hypothetical protein